MKINWRIQPMLCQYVVIILSCLTVSVTLASTVMKLDDRTMTALAGYIVQGKVTSTTSEWNVERTQIHTTVEIQVIETLKGKLPDPNKLILRLLGGRVGDEVIKVVGGPVFKKGEEVILFLYQDIQNQYPVLGLWQGKLRINTESDTGKKIVEGRNISPEEFLKGTRKILEEQKTASEKVDQYKKEN